MKRFLLVSILSLAAASASAVECPFQPTEENYLERAAVAVAATKTCEEGAMLAEACALGKKGDELLAQAAERKCAGDFMPKLSTAEKRIYVALQLKCDKKYKTSDTLIFSIFKAFCHLQVARLYSELYTPAE